MFIYLLNVFTNPTMQTVVGPMLPRETLTVLLWYAFLTLLSLHWCAETVGTLTGQFIITLEG